jgi:5-methylcytosine-specific restriction endonuclease McrA
MICHPCTRCGHWKPRHEFTYYYRSRDHRTVREGRCKGCMNAGAALRTPEERVEERRRQAQRSGKSFLTLYEWRSRAAGKRRAVREQRELRIQRRERRRLIRVLFHALIEHAKQHGMPRSAHPAAVQWRRRYSEDASFRHYEVARNATRRARRRGAIVDPSLTVRSVASMLSRTESCVYCRGAMADDARSVEHVIPLSRGGHHSRENVVVACVRCNLSKRDRMPLEWLLGIAPVASARAA